MAANNQIADALLAWYDVHARNLPWRAGPGEPPREPYHVWLSEIMLQQTTVAAVKPYYAKFLATYPDVHALAAAPEDQVLAHWAGLGYYSRARNLVKCARQVADMGGFPAEEKALCELPGVGAYTAAAIAAIAFGQRAVVVDANVERVVSRLFAIREPLPKSRPAIRAATDDITPGERAGDFAQAMMDLGAGICTTRTLKCLLCPVSDRCAARQDGDPETLPRKIAKKAKPVRRGKAFWIEHAGAVWLVTRANAGLLGGMRALPGDGWSARQNGAGAFPLKGEWKDCGMVTHVFTHLSLELTLHRMTLTAGIDLGEGQWWPIADIEHAGLPTLFAKAARLATA
ncbi:MAG: A/G-specific adenine glycosylase [Pontixanthobacter sp.]